MTIRLDAPVAAKRFQAHHTLDDANDTIIPRVMNVAAINAVNASSLTDGQIIVARGRSADGDGGGGTFRYSSSSTATVDNGIVFAPTAGTGRLLRDGYTSLGFNGPVSDRWYGVKADDSTDDSAALNAAIAATAGRGETLHLGKGRRKCSSPILLVANTRITAAEGAVLVRNCTTTGSNGFIGGSASTKTNNVSIVGPLTIEGPDTTTYSGNVIAIYGDNCTLRGVRVYRYGGTAGGRAVFWRGDNGTIDDFQATEPRQTAGVGGIRMAGGRSFRCINSHVLSGDDTFQFVPGATDNQSIYDGMYIGCTGGSYMARLIVVALVDPVAGNTTAPFTQPAVGSTVAVTKTTDNRLAVNDRIYIDGGGYYTITVVTDTQHITVKNDGGTANASPGTVIPSGAAVLRSDSTDIGAGGAMTATIQGVSFIGIKGFARGTSADAITVRNSDSTGGIDSVTISDVDIDVTGSTSVRHIFVEGSLYGAYPTSNVTMSKVRLRGTYKTAFKAISTDTFGYIDGLNIDRIQADRASVSGAQAFQLFGVRDGSMSDCRVYANGSDGVVLGSSGNTADGFRVGPGVTVRNIDNAQAGVQLAYTNGCAVLRSRFVRSGGATTARGVGNGANALATYISGNDYSSVDTDIVSSNASEGVRNSIDAHQGVGSGVATVSIGKFRSADGNAVLDLYADTSGSPITKIQRTGGANAALVIDQKGTGQIQLKINNVLLFTLASTGRLTLAQDTLLLSGVGNYASDAAAATGGVPIGGIYHNAGAARVRIV